MPLNGQRFPCLQIRLINPLGSAAWRLSICAGLCPKIGQEDCRNYRGGVRHEQLLSLPLALSLGSRRLDVRNSGNFGCSHVRSITESIFIHVTHSAVRAVCRDQRLQRCPFCPNDQTQRRQRETFPHGSFRRETPVQTVEDQISADQVESKSSYGKLFVSNADPRLRFLNRLRPGPDVWHRSRPIRRPFILPFRLRIRLGTREKEPIRSDLLQLSCRPVKCMGPAQDSRALSIGRYVSFASARSVRLLPLVPVGFRV